MAFAEAGSNPISIVRIRKRRGNDVILDTAAGFQVVTVFFGHLFAVGF